MTAPQSSGARLSQTARGSGPVLVLVHGFPLDSRIWDAQVAELSSRHRVIAPDLRGFGRSRSDEPFTMESLADDVHALLESLDALPCVLGGLSMGGYVALAYARKYPKDLNGLLLVDTRAEADTPDGKEGRGKMIELVRAKGSAAVAEQMLPKMVAPDAPQKRPDTVKRLREIMEQCPPKAIEHALAAMRDRPDCTGDLPSIGVPTLILVGESDAITPPAVAERMRDAIPNAKMVVIPEAGHMTPMEQPARVNQAIAEFL